MARGKQLQTSLWGPELRALGGRESRCQIVRHHQLVFRVWWCISLLTTSHLARLPARLAGTRCSSHWCMQIGYYILLPCQSDQSRWRGWKGVCLELPFPHGLGVIQSLLPATMCTTWIFGLPIVGGSGWSVAFPCGSVFLPRVMPAVSLRSISFGLALQWLGLRTKVSSQSWKIILAAPNTQRSGDCISPVLWSNWLSVDFGGVLTLGVFRLGCREKNWINGMVVTERQPCTATLRSEITFVQSAESCGRSGKKQKHFRSPAIRMDNDVASICPHKKQ